MTSLSEGEARSIAGAYDFSTAQTLVDVGGGQGKLLRAILKANATLRGVLFDHPEVLEAARSQGVVEGLSTRCELVAGDFFESVPPGGDLYLLKNIVHDWDDDRAVAILRACRSAMRSTSKLLIIEMVIPAAGHPHFAKFEDLEMLVLLGSQDRTEHEHAALLARSDFRLSRVIDTGDYMSIVEGVPV